MFLIDTVLDYPCNKQRGYKKATSPSERSLAKRARGPWNAPGSCETKGPNFHCHNPHASAGDPITNAARKSCGESIRDKTKSDANKKD
jgi:hypothetical protein